MDEPTRSLVRDRAGDRCEYCRLLQAALPSSTFQVDHIVAKQHKGRARPDNLALACERCNLYKGTNLSAIDPESGQVVRLFHPREDRWEDHFRIDNGVVVGLTDRGRATVELLNMNAELRVKLRRDQE